MIHHNKLLLTEFGKNFVKLNQWRQNDVKSAAWLQVIQGFWYFARSWSREIQVNPRNPTKFARTQKIPRNSVEILSNTCQYSIFETYFSYWGYLLAVNLQIYLRTSSLKRANNIPKLPGVDYVAKNWALAMMLKALPLVHFWSILLLKEQMMTSARKMLKTLVCKTDWLLAKFALKITTKLTVFYWLLFGEVFPENSCEIGQFFCEFVPKNPPKFDFFLRDLSEALVIVATLGTEESGHCREVETRVNVWTVCQKKLLLWRGGLQWRFDCGFSHSCSYYSLGATPRSVSVLRSVQTKEEVVHAFLRRIK